MTPVPIEHCLVLSALLLGVGAAGFLFRRNAIIMLMSVELMLNAVNLTFVACARHHGLDDGTVYGLLVIAIAAAEAAVGLAICLCMFRVKGTVEADRFDELRG